VNPKNGMGLRGNYVSAWMNCSLRKGSTARIKVHSYIYRLHLWKWRYLAAFSRLMVGTRASDHDVVLRGIPAPMR